jgi:hypothetical protein
MKTCRFPEVTNVSKKILPPSSVEQVLTVYMWYGTTVPLSKLRKYEWHDGGWTWIWKEAALL